MTVKDKLKKTIAEKGFWGAIVNFITKILDRFFLQIFRLLPIKSNYIVLESEGDFTDNIRVFYDYLIANDYNKTYRIIWIVHEPKKYKKEKNVIFISRFNKGINIKADYYAGISKYFVFSHAYWLRNWRKEQIVIGTTHSAAQLKATGKKMGKIVDYVLACSDYVKEIRKRSFELSDEYVLVLGMPRIDLLYRHKECISKIMPKYNGEKIILSMETFKQAKGWEDSENVDSFAINVIRDRSELENLDEFLGMNRAKLIIKIHHLQDTSFLKVVKLANILYLTDDDLSDYDIQVNELLENADILLTDYSSVFYEFLLLNRPIGFLIGDIKEYTRGFIVENPFEEMPGKKIKKLYELLEFLEDCFEGKDDYIKEREEIRKKVFSYDDNKNCERLMKWILDNENTRRRKL